MRNPRKNRNLAVAVCVASLVMAIVVFSIPGEARPPWVSIVFGLGGIILTLGAGVSASIWWDDAKRFERMARGEGILARWTVPIEQWRLFVQQSKNTDRQPGELPNVINFPAEPSLSGEEVIFSDDAIKVAGDFHSLPADVDIQMFRTFVEVREKMHGSRSATKFLMYRFPLVPGAESAMTDVQNAYRAAYVKAAATGWTKVAIVLGVIVAIFALVVLVLKSR